MKSQLPLLLFLILATGCGPQIALLGLDENGKEVEQQVGSGGYSDDLGGFLSSANESVIPALAEADSTHNWSVRTVDVGLIISGDVGIGPYRVGAMGRFRVAFSNSSDPALP